MPYTIQATSGAPALVLYLLDVSASMARPLGRQRRIDVVSAAFTAARKQMVLRSMKGQRLMARYRVGVFAYSEDVHDVLDGVRAIGDIPATPELPLHTSSDAAKGFEHIEEVLRRELAGARRSPAPLVCHMTDGQYTGQDPAPVVQRILKMGTDDGPVLVENIFISDQVLRDPVADPKQWPGIVADTPLASDYARALRSMSSVLPESYRQMMRDEGYSIGPGALMMLPGASPELVKMGFVMSVSTALASRT